ncbi:MAG TPA: hypothetical protein VFF06_05460 [Polyangia bacterium]|nr:hypothetical protein [Polyangia bacterium]
MSRNLALVGAAAALLAIGCRNDNNNVTPADFAGTASTDMAGGSTDLATGGSTDLATGFVANCNSYPDSTIAAMRMGKKSGCFKIGGTSVVALASVASSKTGTIAVQDAAGGDYSGIIAECHTGTSKTAMKFPCTQLATFGSTTVGHGVTIQGFFDYSSKYLSETLYILDQPMTDSGAAVTPPTPISIAASAITFGSPVDPAKLFQKVTVTGGPMKVFEMAPPQLNFGTGAFPGCSTIPYTFGFGVIPSSSTATPGPTCTMGQMPMPAATQDPAEILVSTNFYKTFSKTTDCDCVKNATDLLAIGTSLPSFGGILSQDTSGATPIPQIIPTVNADFGL